MRRDYSNFLKDEPEKASNYSLPKIVKPFESQSRTQLHDYETREERARPNPTFYRPKYDFVLKQ